MVPLNVFFDVDHTILGTDGSLRPGTSELFERLVDEGHRVYVWSGMGIRWDDVHRTGLTRYVTDVFHKPVTRFAGSLERHGIPVTPDFIVDDYPGIVEFFGGVCVREYWAIAEQPEDREMHRVYRLFTEHRDAGHPARADLQAANDEPAA